MAWKIAAVCLVTFKFCSFLLHYVTATSHLSLQLEGFTDYPLRRQWHTLFLTCSVRIWSVYLACCNYKMSASQGFFFSYKSKEYLFVEETIHAQFLER